MPTPVTMQHGLNRLRVLCYCLVFLMICLSASGCVSKRNAAVHSSDLSSEASVDTASEEDVDSEERTESDKRTPGKTKDEKASGKADPARKKGTKRKQDDSDLDRKLRAAAKELAIEHSPVKAMKLCYAEKDNEWWVILYCDIGHVIDVRNFFWDWELQTFKRFLVVKRIPKNELRRIVNRHERGRRCTILKPPRTESKDSSKSSARKKRTPKKER